MSKLVNPIPQFGDGRGGLLDAGYIWIGEAGTDPEVVANQVPLFWDKAMTIAAPQPLRTLGGMIVQNYNLGIVYYNSPDFSITIRDADLNLITYVASAFDIGDGTAFQPLDATLTAITGLSTTALGRSLLTVTDAVDIRAAAALGGSSVLNVATSAEFRNDTASLVLTTDKVWGAATSVALTQSGGNVAVDLNSGLNFTLAMTGGPWTLSNPTNGKDGQSGKIEITQDVTGSRVLNYGPNWKFAGGTDPVLSTAANSKDVLFYEVLSDGNVLGSLVRAIA
jgi:hypothetical protein